MRAEVCRAALTKPATAGVLRTAHWLYAVPLPTLAGVLSPTQ
jgi:hypothetical protein